MSINKINTDIQNGVITSSDEYREVEVEDKLSYS